MLIAVGCILSLVLAHRAVRAGHSPWFHVIGVLVSAHRTRQPQIPALAFARARFHAQFGDYCRVEGLPDLPGSVLEINRLQTAQRMSEYRFRLLGLSAMNTLTLFVLFLPYVSRFTCCQLGSENPNLLLCGLSYLAWGLGYLGLLALEKIDRVLGGRFLERGRACLLLCGLAWGLLATLYCLSQQQCMVGQLG
jgi:hypothetical protein